MIRRSTGRSCFRHPAVRLIMALCALQTAAVAVAAPEVSVRSLLPQMTDLGFLARRPNPYFTAAQASSYDRASKSPAEGWFANGDAGQFLRTETNSGRTEYVMADLKGPGAVVRIWSANPAATIRMYFDGEGTPRVQEKMADFLTGKVAPFGDAFSYGAAQGTNIYFPFPYAKSLKITVDDTDKNGARSLYYHVGYRTYEAGTRVRTYDPKDLRGLAALMTEIGRDLLAREPKAYRVRAHRSIPQRRLAKGESISIRVGDGEGAIQNLTANIPFPIVQTVRPLEWSDPNQPHNVLRTMRLQISADGESCIDVPLGDFFGAGPGPAPFNSLPFQVTAAGDMTCRLPMPFRRGAEIRLRNDGDAEVPITLSWDVIDWKFGKDSYHLHSQWTADKGRTRPMRDMRFLDASGEGMWVGTSMMISNPTPAWWGEGDEKAYVDNETFPSTFGTGTEDYFGYAWCSPILFDRPYHGQPRCDGPGNFGQTNVHRYQLFDPITYSKRLRFDIEMWHWADVEATFARTAYWYAKPGGSGPTPLRAVVLTPEMTPPKPVEGAIEGEKLTIVSKSGGETSNQGGFWELSSGEQLWWVDPKVGDKLVLRVPVKESGTYEVVGNFCHARDYGIHTIRVNGKEIAKPIDFFIRQGVEWKRISLGTFELPAGDTILEIECAGHRPEALPRNMFGLDYLLLNRK